MKFYSQNVCSTIYRLLFCLLPLLLWKNEAYGQTYITEGSQTVAEISSTGSFSTITTPGFGSTTIAAEGSDIFVGDNAIPGLINPQIQEYTSSGTLVSSNLISNIPVAANNGFDNGLYMAVSGSDLFVVTGNEIGEYTTTGVAVNTDLVTLPTASTSSTFVTSIAVSGTNLYVTQNNGPFAGTVTDYNTANGAEVGGTPIISGLDNPDGIAVSGSDIFLSDESGTEEYTTSGTPVRTSELNLPIINSGGPLGVTGNELFADGPASVNQYTTAGALVQTFALGTNNYGIEIAVANPVVLTPVAPAAQTSTVTTSSTGQYNTSTITPITAAGGLGTTATVVAGQTTANNPNYASTTTPRNVVISTTTLGSNFTSLASDVVSISGNAGDIFTAQLTFNLSAANQVGGASNMTLLWLNPATNNWINAVLGNTDIPGVTDATGGELDFKSAYGGFAAGSFAAFQAEYGTNLSLYLGAYGVDTTDDEVWAVIDHNSDFGVGNLDVLPQAAPEPSTWALLLGGLGGLLFLRRFRREKISVRA